MIHTELTAINEILGIAGEAPVSAVDSPLPLAQQARETLAIAVGHLQSSPWWFNDYETTWSPNAEGHILVPPELTSVSCVRPGTILVVRGNKLHNLTKDTPIFTEPVRVRVRLSLPFEELPNAARLRAVALAKQRLAPSTLGELPDGLAEELRLSRIELMAEHIRQQKASFLESDSMIQRRAFVRGWRRSSAGDFNG